MKKIMLCLPLVLILAAIPAQAEEKPTPEEMMTMLKVSGAVEVLDQVTNQLIANMELQVREKKPNLPHEAYFVIKDEFNTGFREWMKTLLVKQMDYYSKQLTKSEVLELTQMYESAAYKKLIKIGQAYIAQELQPMLQKEVPAVTEAIIKRVNDRLIREGIIKNAKAGV